MVKKEMNIVEDGKLDISVLEQVINIDGRTKRFREIAGGIITYAQNDKRLHEYPSFADYVADMADSDELRKRIYGVGERTQETILTNHHLLRGVGIETRDYKPFGINIKDDSPYYDYSDRLDDVLDHRDNIQEDKIDAQLQYDIYGIFDGLDVDDRSFNAIGYSTNEPIKGSGEIKTKFTDISKRVIEEYGYTELTDEDVREANINLYVSGELVDRLDEDISNYSPEDVGELQLSVYDTSDIENQLKENETEGDGIGQMMLDLEKLRLDIIMKSREHENGYGESIRELQEWTNYHHNSIEAIERDISRISGGMSGVEGVIRDHKTETNRRFGVVERELSNTTDNLGIVESRVNEIENNEEEWHGVRYWLQSAHMTVQRYGGYKLAIPLAATALVTGASIIDNIINTVPDVAYTATLTETGGFQLEGTLHDSNGIDRVEVTTVDKTSGRNIGSEVIRSDSNGRSFDSIKEGELIDVGSKVDSKPHIERDHEFEMKTKTYSSHSHIWNPTTWANEYRFWNPFSWGVEMTPKTIDVTVEEASSNAGNSGGNGSGNGNGGGVVQPRDPAPPAPQPPAPPAPQPEPPAPTPQPEEEPRGRSGGSGG